MRFPFFGRRMIASCWFLMFCCSAASADRPAWTTSRVHGTATTPAPYRVEQVFGGQVFERPVEFVNAPGTDSMFLLEQSGAIYELESESSSERRLVGKLSELVEDFQASYGLAFHPEFAKNREIFVCYIQRGNKDDGSIVSRFRLTSDGPLEIEKDSEEILYRWLAGGHNGGSVQFGPDGYMYVSAGDAAAPFPPDHLKAGQDLSNLLASIVRIDVDGRSEGLPYRIPDDNPFVGLKNARAEIFAYGFRNPWRMAFDRQTGDLWAGDVGWELWEMVYLVESGGNYGWSIVEGPHDVDPDGQQGPTPILKPAASHSHAEARSITGGQVYYGDRFPELRGAYVYGDHVTGRLWSLRKNSDGGGFESPVEIARSPLQVICFGLHNNGELYIVDYVGGIYRLVSNPVDDSAGQFPQTLGESGLFSQTDTHALAEGVLAYEVIAESWMDGATAERFIGIPGDAQIGVYKKGGGWAAWDGKHRGSWKFPTDSVLGKTISLDGHRIETQIMHYDGQAWQPYTYLWNESQTDARLAADVSQSIELEIDGQTHRWGIYNRGDCMVCHTNANDMLLGFKPNQLRRPASGHDDQLEHFASLGLFEETPPDQKPLADPTDPNADLEVRARSYLHVNCGHCHRENGGGTGAINLQFAKTLEQTKLIDTVPLQGTFGIDNARVVAPGDPARSVLLYRFCKLGPGHMPKLGGTNVDQEGASLIFDWIAQLESKMDPNDLTAQISALKEAASNENQLVTLLGNTPNSLVATHAVRAGLLDEAERKSVLAASQQLPPTTKDLFESFIPIAERTERLGNNVRPQEILAVRGDVSRGRALFMSETLACKTCHSIERGKESVGPNLSELPRSQYQRAVLLENILQPSKTISKEYQTHAIQTDDGRLVSGVIKADGEVVVLRDAQNKEYRIAKDEIEFRQTSNVSIMPEKLLNDLTLQQARDLIEFLSSF